MRKIHLIERHGFWIWVNGSLLIACLNEAERALRVGNLAVFGLASFITGLNAGSMFWSFRKGRKANQDA